MCFAFARHLMALAAKKELLLPLVLKELILSNNKLTSLPPSKWSNYDSTCTVHVVSVHIQCVGLPI